MIGTSVKHGSSISVVETYKHTSSLLNNRWRASAISSPSLVVVGFIDHTFLICLIRLNVLLVPSLLSVIINVYYYYYYLYYTGVLLSSYCYLLFHYHLVRYTFSISNYDGQSSIWSLCRLRWKDRARQIHIYIYIYTKCSVIRLTKIMSHSRSALRNSVN